MDYNQALVHALETQRNAALNREAEATAKVAMLAAAIEDLRKANEALKAPPPEAEEAAA